MHKVINTDSNNSMYTVLHNVHFQSGNLNILWHISSKIIFVSLFQLLLNDLSPVDWKKNYAGRSILWKTGALYVIIKYWFGEDYVIFVVKYCGGWKGCQSRLNARLNPLWEICFVRLAPVWKFFRTFDDCSLLRFLQHEY